jgi:heme-degrading monooxygenase HmoA
MAGERKGQVAVIFVSQRTPDDATGYGNAAEAMDALAAQQPGYVGIDSARDADGFGITVSYWEDDVSALAWCAHAEHAAVRDRGRSHWYSSYEVIVAEVQRDYRWKRA